MLIAALAGLLAGTPARDLLFSSEPDVFPPDIFPPEPEPPSMLGCDAVPCKNANDTCINYPEYAPLCRTCFNDVDLPDPADPDVPADDCSVVVASTMESQCQIQMKIADPPECCIFGGPFADEDIHSQYLSGLPHTTGLGYGVKATWTNPRGHETTFCFVHKKVLMEYGAKAGYHPGMVTTLFAFDPPHIIKKGVMPQAFCHRDDNGIPPGLSMFLASKGTVNWAYDCDPVDGPFAKWQAEIGAATAFVFSSPSNGCGASLVGQEPCQTSTPEYDKCVSTVDVDDCNALQQAQWDEWKASKHPLCTVCADP